VTLAWSHAARESPLPARGSEHRIPAHERASHSQSTTNKRLETSDCVRPTYVDHVIVFDAAFRSEATLQRAAAAYGAMLKPESCLSAPLQILDAYATACWSPDRRGLVVVPVVQMEEIFKTTAHDRYCGDAAHLVNLQEQCTSKCLRL
jgi:hypothetical protein